MTIYVPSPVFTDNVGQLLSHEDLEVVRQNVGYAELLSYRLMPGFPSSGGAGTRTPFDYPSSGDFRIWYGALKFKTGMTTLTVEGIASNAGSVQFRVYVEGVLRATIATGSTWSGTWAMSGFTDGQILDVQVEAHFTSGGAPSNAKYVVTAIYGSPVVYGTAWPGTPTFTTAWTATKLNQLVAAADWVYNRANAVPIRPDLSLLYNLGPFAGNSQILYAGSIGKWFSNSEFRFGGQVTNASSPGLQLEFYFNGSLVYTTANLPIGTTTLAFGLSLAAYSVGDTIEVSVWCNNTVAAAHADWSFCRVTMNALRSSCDTSAIYTSMTATPTEDVNTSAATIAAYLNNLSATVLAAYNRIQATPAVFNRVWAVRRFFSKHNSFAELIQKRGRPRFIRTGNKLVVRGKGVSVGWGPLSVPTNEAGLDWDNYSFLHTQSVVDGDKVQTQTVYLDSLPGLNYGLPYYLIGDVTWCEEVII